jgi:hypothetical protein
MSANESPDVSDTTAKGIIIGTMIGGVVGFIIGAVIGGIVSTLSGGGDSDDEN